MSATTTSRAIPYAVATDRATDYPLTDKAQAEKVDQLLDGRANAPGWTALTLGSGWSNVAGTTAQYRKGIDGTVEVHGIVLSTGTPSGTNGGIIGALPAGWRPAGERRFMGQATQGGEHGSATVFILANGDVKVGSQSTAAGATFVGFCCTFSTAV